MELTLMILHLIFAVVLIAVVLLQQGKQAGLSGAVAGGAETFFGKNKGRTIDAILKKATGVVAVLFIVTSISLAYVATRPEEAPVVEETQVTETAEDVAAEAEAEKAE
ncbi:MAG: preprotein translocase subunit SecG [Clostridia bacterium]|nr:preprotein translocase subunit SecG [Clostridia bacterium]